MYDIIYTSPRGEQWRLTDPDSPVFIVEGTVEGLVGQIQERAIVPIGAPGQLLQGITVEAMRGGFEVLARVGDWEPGVLGRLLGEFRRSFSTTQYGVLAVEGGALGRVSCRVRLDAPLAAMMTDPDNAADMQLPVRLVADGGVWWTDTLHRSGRVEISNPGDVMIFPRIRWQGSGKRVTMPSGAVVDLPTARGWRILTLDNAESCVVTDDHGVVDHTAWRALRGGVLAEGVPPAGKRLYVAPPDVEIRWQVGVLDPWT